MNPLYKRNTFVAVASGWGMLGFYRGTQNYYYNYKCKIEEYNKYMIQYNEAINYNEKNKTSYYAISKPKNKPNKFYITQLFFGIGSSFIYLNPCTFFICVIKELYRLEINIFNLEDEKNKSEYYDIL